jgi:hypothetical protein
LSHPWSKHQEWTENSEDEKAHKAPDLQLEGQKTVPVVKDSIRNYAGENGSMSEKDGAEGVRTLAQEGETCGAIRVSRKQTQINSGDMP